MKFHKPEGAGMWKSRSEEADSLKRGYAKEGEKDDNMRCVRRAKAALGVYLVKTSAFRILRATPLSL